VNAHAEGAFRPIRFKLVAAIITTLLTLLVGIVSFWMLAAEGDLERTQAQWLIGGGSMVASLLAISIQIAVRKDVVAQQRAAETIAAQSRELELQNARIRQINEALRRTNRDLDQFAYVASHDLKAPLRGIASLSEWIEEDIEGDEKGASREHLHLMRRRVGRMEALIEGILAYSRAGRKQLPSQLVAVDLMLRDVVDLLAPPAEIQVVIDAGMPMLRTEKVLLQQVWMNLIANAIKHGHAGDRAPLIQLSARRDGAWWVFTVRDNGRGIPHEYHGRIFAMFQTLAPRDRVEGTGIGLSIVRKLVESRGGRVWVESTDGGAAFHFTWRE
jgi:signal transduction histidine kinase